MILFGLAAPVGALSFSSVRRPGLVFAAYVTIVVAMVPLEGVLQARAPSIDTWVVTVFFAINIVSVSVIMFVAMRTYVRSRNRLAAALADERDRSDRILRNVLPGPIADRLVGGEHPIADRYDSVGVLIADIVDFTSLSETMSATPSCTTSTSCSGLRRARRSGRRDEGEDDRRRVPRDHRRRGRRTRPRSARGLRDRDA